MSLMMMMMLMTIMVNSIMIFKNTEHKTVEMLLTMPTTAERGWWINTPHHSPPDNGELSSDDMNV